MDLAILEDRVIPALLVNQGLLLVPNLQGARHCLLVLAVQQFQYPH